MTIYTDKRLLRTGLIGGTFSRHSGNMREVACQNAALAELGVQTEHILHFHQTHSNTILSISSAQAAQALLAAPLQDADAWVFSPCISGWGAAIVTADCVPVFLWDDTGSYAALAHCGWRGVVKGLAQKAAQALLTQNPHLRLNAWLGPHIQACCFEVQEDVAAQFPANCVLRKKDKIYVDLNIEIKRQLTQAGIAAEKIQTPYYCTCGDKENFFSWRRDHEKNMLLSFLYKP